MAHPDSPRPRMPDPDDAPPSEPTTPAASPETSAAANPDATPPGDGTATDAVAPQDAGAPPAAAAMTPAQCGQRLAELFPALFAGAPKPLKLRVHADIQARAPGVFSKAVLSAFMRRHTNGTAYLHAMARETQRYGLDGEPAGEIAPEHRQGALDELARRRERHAAQRAAERDARRDAERAAQQAQAEQAQARRERAQLLRDFERTTLTAVNFGALKGLAPEALEQQLALARSERAERAPMFEARGGQGGPGGPRRDGPPHGEPRPGRRADAPRGPREPRPGDRPRGPRPPRPPR